MNQSTAWIHKICFHTEQTQIKERIMTDSIRRCFVLPLNVQRDCEDLAFHPNGCTVQETAFFDFVF